MLQKNDTPIAMYVVAIIIKLLDFHSTYLNVQKYTYRVELNPFLRVLRLYVQNDVIWLIYANIIQSVLLMVIIYVMLKISYLCEENIQIYVKLTLWGILLCGALICIWNYLPFLNLE